MRIAAGTAGLLVGLVITGGVAGAQVPGSDNSSEVLPNNEVRVDAPGSVDVAAPAQAVAPAVAGQPVGAAAAAQAAPEGSLPVTGGDIAGMLVLGAAAVGAGTVLVRRNRATA